MGRSTTIDLHCYGSKLRAWVFNQDKSETIVLIHGFRGTHHGLQKIVDQLGDYRLVVPDLPAFGASTPMTARKHNIDGYADCIKEVIAKLDLKKVHLFGHSFGSIVAANVTSRHPEVVKKLVLVNPIAQPTAGDNRKLLLKFATFYYWLGKSLPVSMGRALLSNGLMVKAVSVMMAKTNDKPLRESIHAAHKKHFSTFHNPKLLNSIYQVSISSSVIEFAGSIRTQTLLIVGAKDNIAPLDGQKLLHSKFTNSRLFVVKKAGHLTHYETPKEIASATRAFLAEP